MRCSGRAKRRLRALCALPILALLAGSVLVSPASAEDVIVVKGDRLRGQVVDLTPDGVSFDPIHGVGTLEVAWEDVEALETEGRVDVLYGVSSEARGRVLGLEDGHVLVGDSRTSARRIQIDALYHAFAEGARDDTLYERLRSRYRFWSASLDAGASYIDSSTDTTNLSTAFRLERKRKPTRLLLEGSFLYATEDEQGEERQVTQNLLQGFTRGELDTTERTFVYASTRGTHDQDQHLSLRLEPRGGFGVRIVQGPRFNLSTDAGVAWIYEDYFGTEPAPGVATTDVVRRGRDNYWTVAFGAAADAKLPLGSIWRAKAEYLPAVDDWADNYLVRLETSLEFPLLAWLSFKVSLEDLYDNQPPEGAVRNKVTAVAALSLRF